MRLDYIFKIGIEVKKYKLLLLKPNHTFSEISILLFHMVL